MKPTRSDGHTKLESTVCFNSLDAPRDRFAVDSPLEGTGFEPSVPLL